MKNFKYFLASLLLCLSLNINADEKDVFGEIHVSVNGLVCDFCAQSIQKLFNKEESVEAVDINMDEGIIKIDLKDGYNMDDNLITKLITDSGYNVERIYRVE